MNQLIIRNDVHRLSKNKSFINTFFLILILFLYYSLEPINLVMLVIVYMLISKKIMLISKKKNQGITNWNEALLSRSADKGIFKVGV